MTTGERFCCFCGASNEPDSSRCAWCHTSFPVIRTKVSAPVRERPLTECDDFEIEREKTEAA